MGSPFLQLIKLKGFCMKVKKLLGVIAIAVIMFGMAACDDDEGGSASFEATADLVGEIYISYSLTDNTVTSVKIKTSLSAPDDNFTMNFGDSIKTITVSPEETVTVTASVSKGKVSISSYGGFDVNIQTYNK